uniref:Arrestin_C domain-containing protein n=1 Tax=Wuchereria bancrofti TaxID=6293 RepID=A0A1I8E9U5_WUCBA
MLFELGNRIIVTMASSSNMKDTFSDENLPYHVDILLSKKIYNPGDTIHGEVIFTLEKNLSCDLINVQLFGLIRVFWIDKKAGNGCFRPLPREQKRVMIDETAILWSEDKINCKKPTQPTLNDISRLSTTIAIRANKHERNGNFRGIETGSHKFKFTFQLPKEGLYTSFDLGNCDGRCYLDVELSVSKRWLVPGEAIPVQVYIDNRSGKSIKFSHLSIRQHVFCIATHPLKCAKEWFQDTLGVGMDAHKIPNGSKYKYVPNFNVPALIPGFEINGCMTLEYDLKLDVGFDRITMSSDMKHIVCTLTIPIFIGTSSITDTNILQKSKFQEAAVSPPNYYDISPPSYDECFSKNPVVNETAD